MNQPIKTILMLFFVVTMGTAFSSKINITVKSNDKACTGLGFTVDGARRGGFGKKYKTKGPRGKVYSFGYRIGFISSKDIYCGDLVLEQDSFVSLITKGGICLAKLEHSSFALLPVNSR